MIKFGTSGFRAKLAEGFTKENAQKIAQALSIIIKKKKSTNPVIIGYDKRFMSDFFAKWMAEVFAGNGIKSKVFTQAVPTPAVMFGVKQDNLDYGITITASHNPYFYNGIKITTKGGRDATEEFTEELEKLANKNLKIKTIYFDEGKAQKLISDYDNTKEYIKNLDKFVSKNLKEKNTKILFNAMYGVTGDCARLFAKHFKLKNFDIINDVSDPYFNNILPCPNELELEEFKKQVVRGRYKVGLAVDADGDRLGIVDEKGEYYSSNIIMAIVYYFLVKYRNLQGDVVRTYPTSIILDKLADCFGYKCHETKVGFKNVSSKMLETNALLGGESSGGFTMRNYTPTKDSFFSIAVFLDAITTINKPLSAIVEEVKEYCGYISTYVEGSTLVNNKKKFLKILAKKNPNFAYKPTEIIREDGVKYIFEGGNWALLRFSGTEDLLRYYVEFQTEIECERNLKAIQTFVENINKNKKIK